MVRRERTRPEEAVAAALVRNGIRFRRNVRSLPGSPDLANKTRRVAIFVHGCFWHRHPGCPKATTPKTNTEFWQNKFAANLAREMRKEAALREMGYEVRVIWECETRDAERLERQVALIIG
jgi:DNA mismatch endonuclease (patch repair protein)